MIGSQSRPRAHWRTMLWLCVATALLVPLAAMQVTAEVDWAPLDFAAAAILLAGGAAGIELVTRLTCRPVYRAAAGVALTSAVLVLWAAGAVGIA